MKHQIINIGIILEIFPTKRQLINTGIYYIGNIYNETPINVYWYYTTKISMKRQYYPDISFIKYCFNIGKMSTLRYWDNISCQ